MRVAVFVPVGVVLLALGALGAVAQLDHPAAAAAPVTATRPVTVSSADRACPPALGGGSGTVASIAAPTQASGSVVSGQAELTALPQAGLALRPVSPVSPVSLTSAGALSLLTVPAASSTAKKSTQTPAGWSVSASGTMAQAIEAEVAQSSGLAGVRCAEPGSDIWFAGPGQQNGASQIQLDLMNVDSLAANVDIRLITDAGPIQLGTGTGITVAPHTTMTQSLSSAAGNSAVVAIEVHTTAGRVAADVSEGGSHGSTTSWLPSAAEPSTKLVIPGVPQSSNAAGLYLVVPGSVNAKVNVVAMTPQGQFRPFSSQAVELPSESASYVALTPLGGAAAALEITSNVPVTAAVLVPGSGVGAFTAATAPISEQAVIAGNTNSSGLSASVVLSAPAGAARVRVTEIAEATGSSAAATAARASQVSSVPAGRTVVVPVKAPSGAKSGAPFAIVITPLAGSGPLYAARVETRGQTVVSIIPAVSALTTISLPPVRDSYDAISP
jgi:hypothetical protein